MRQHELETLKQEVLMQFQDGLITEEERDRALDRIGRMPTRENGKSISEWITSIH